LVLKRKSCLHHRKLHRYACIDDSHVDVTRVNEATAAVNNEHTDSIRNRRQSLDEASADYVSTLPRPRSSSVIIVDVYADIRGSSLGKRRQTTVRLSRTTIFSVFAGYFFGNSFRDKASVII